MNQSHHSPCSMHQVRSASFKGYVFLFIKQQKDYSFYYFFSKTSFYPICSLNYGKIPAIVKKWVVFSKFRHEN